MIPKQSRLRVVRGEDRQAVQSLQETMLHGAPVVMDHHEAQGTMAELLEAMVVPKAPLRDHLNHQLLIRSLLVLKKMAGAQFRSRRRTNGVATNPRDPLPHRGDISGPTGSSPYSARNNTRDICSDISFSNLKTGLYTGRL